MAIILCGTIYTIVTSPLIVGCVFVIINIILVIVSTLFQSFMLGYCFDVKCIFTMIGTLKNASVLWIVFVNYLATVVSITIICLLSMDSNDITARVEMIIITFGCISIPVIIIYVLIIILPFDLLLLVTLLSLSFLWFWSMFPLWFPLSFCWMLLLCIL